MDVTDGGQVYYDGLVCPWINASSVERRLLDPVL